MQDAELLDVLAPEAERLLDRHLANAREWFPHELVPWGRGRDFDPDEPWFPAEGVGEAVRSALLVNLLTEDNLPHYFRAIDAAFGDKGAWGEWGRRWTAEEGRHSIVIRDYLTVTRAIDPVALERGRMAQVIGGWDSPLTSVADALAYTSLQELATRVSHSNTGRMLEDDHGRRLMARVSGDEALHHVFYRDLMSCLIDVDPSVAVPAIDRTVRNFTMPGTAIADFTRHAKAIARAGIYDVASHHASVVVPVVVGAWKLADLTGLDPTAEEARVRCLGHIDRLGRVAERLRDRRADKAVAV